MRTTLLAHDRPAPRTRFRLPPDRSATEPPEARGTGRRRDDVRLLVARPDTIRHRRFADLADELSPGDLVVVNTSATMPAAVDGHRADGRPVTVHFSSPAATGQAWIVELRDPARVTDARRGEAVVLPRGAVLTLDEATPDPTVTSGSRLWRASLAMEGPVPAYLDLVGRPITYGYVPARWPLSTYQTVFATEPGSAEMPSAGRPFSERIVTALVRRGVTVAPVVLHTGVSSLESHELPLPERYRVPLATARLVNAARAGGRRVIAVGTTVARALETVAGPRGSVTPGAGTTELVLGPDRPARVVDGLVTGWHEPGASHLWLLEAVAGADLVGAAYDAALDGDYLWHEFGDACLLLPER